MTTRKAFLGSALAVAGISAIPSSGAARAAGAKASPTPKPSASPQAKPSALARELAASLQRDLPKAHLSDSMVQKIAEDIEGNFAIGKAFRNRTNHELPAPDFVFSATEDARP